MKALDLERSTDVLSEALHSTLWSDGMSRRVRQGIRLKSSAPISDLKRCTVCCTQQSDCVGRGVHITHLG